MITNCITQVHIIKYFENTYYEHCNLKKITYVLEMYLKIILDKYTINLLFRKYGLQLAKSIQEAKYDTLPFQNSKYNSAYRHNERDVRDVLQTCILR